MKTGTDFKQILKGELEARLNRNPRYSLRAFAKDLKMAPALLSDILNGKRGMSREWATKVATRLGYAKSEKDLFCDLVESQHARSRVAKAQALARLEKRVSQGAVLKFLTLDQDQFSLISEWYPMAILELMKSPECKATAKPELEWFAKKLQLTPIQVSNALERMTKLGMIEMREGKWIVLSPNVQTPDGVASRALKSHHEQLMKKGLEALYTQPVEERDFRGLTIRCKKSDVSRVREKMKKFLQDLDAELSADQDGTEVYQLSTQFFSLTKEYSSKETL